MNGKILEIQPVVVKSEVGEKKFEQKRNVCVCFFCYLDANVTFATDM